MAPDEIKLDVKDRKILLQLDDNCRQSLGQIAKKVGLSKQVVDYRIKRLEEKGIIRGYITVMNMTKLGFYTFRVYIKFAKPSVDAVNGMVNYLRKHKHVAWLVDAYGEWDLCFVFVTRSIDEFHHDWQDFLLKYRDHIRDKDITIISEAYMLRRSYLLGEKQGERRFDVMNSPPEQRVEFDGDKLDWEILRQIAANARAELQTIAGKVGLSPKAVSYRIKNLVKRGVIQSFRAFIDVGALGYEYYKIFLGLSALTKEKEKELFTWLQMNPNVVYVTKPIGQADYEFEFQARGREEFWKVIDDLRTRFKDIVTLISSIQFAREYKFIYLPEVTPV
jgi:DNA-binding Lrp family transcriptional regulator